MKESTSIRDCKIYITSLRFDVFIHKNICHEPFSGNVVFYLTTSLIAKYHTIYLLRFPSQFVASENISQRPLGMGLVRLD